MSQLGADTMETSTIVRGNQNVCLCAAMYARAHVCTCVRMCVRVRTQVQGHITIFNMVIQVSFIGTGTSEQMPDGSEPLRYLTEDCPGRETI